MKECKLCHQAVCFIGFYPNHTRHYRHEDDKHDCKNSLLYSEIQDVSPSKQGMKQPQENNG